MWPPRTLAYGFEKVSVIGVVDVMVAPGAGLVTALVRAPAGYPALKIVPGRSQGRGGRAIRRPAAPAGGGARGFTMRGAARRRREATPGTHADRGKGGRIGADARLRGGEHREHTADPKDHQGRRDGRQPSGGPPPIPLAVVG